MIKAAHFRPPFAAAIEGNKPELAALAADAAAHAAVTRPLHRAALDASLGAAVASVQRHSQLRCGHGTPLQLHRQHERTAVTQQLDSLA